MNTGNNLEQQCAQAMQRINEGINRSAGQHKRRVRAGGLPPTISLASPKWSQQATVEHIDTEALQDNRASVNFGCPGHPAQASLARWDDATEGDNGMGGMRMLACGLIALALTALAGFAAFLIVRFMH